VSHLALLQRLDSPLFRGPGQVPANGSLAYSYFHGEVSLTPLPSRAAGTLSTPHAYLLYGVAFTHGPSLANAVANGRVRVVPQPNNHGQSLSLQGSTGAEYRGRLASRRAAQGDNVPFADDLQDSPFPVT